MLSAFCYRHRHRHELTAVLVKLAMAQFFVLLVVGRQILPRCMYVGRSLLATSELSVRLSVGPSVCRRREL